MTFGSVSPITPIMLKEHPVVLCRLPYPDHPKGCPNVRRCATVARRLDTFTRPHYTLIWTEFDLAAHVERMRAKHPRWSDRQCRCVLYWQGTARKALREACEPWREAGWSIIYCPEIHGVDVTATMLRCADVHLEWPVQHIARTVALAVRP
jgi:hypothetical protein